jgi:hypothetical protein
VCSKLEAWPIFIELGLGGDIGGESPASSSSEASSGCCGGGGGGYLEDAVAHWSGRCKRQRTTVAEEAPPPRCPAMASEDLQSILQVNQSLCSECRSFFFRNRSIELVSSEKRIEEPMMIRRDVRTLHGCPICAVHYVC